MERSIDIFLVAEMEGQKYAIYRFHAIKYLDMSVNSILYDLTPKFTSINSIEEKEEKILEFLENMETKMRKEIKKFIILKAKEAKSVWEGGIFSLNAK